MIRKIIAVVMCVFVLSTLIYGCSNEKNKSASGLTIMYKVTQNGGSDTTIMDTIAKNTGVDATYIKAPSSSYTEKLNSTLASGNLPDIVYIDESNMNIWIEEGALLPLDDLIEKYAPNVQRTLTDDDKKQLVNQKDGKLYGTPYILRMPVDKTMGVRRDWMNKLGLSDPDTIEELEYVLTQFKENAHILNPGGKVIPCTGNLGSFFLMFDIMPSGENGNWTVDSEGNYISVYEHQNYIKCIELLRRFYAKGLIDTEFLMRSANQEELYTLFNSGVIGMGSIYSTRLREITETLRQSNPDALFDYMAPVKGVTGERKIVGRRIFATMACITVAAKGKEEECMKYIDYFYSKEGDLLLNYGIEGVHYDMVDGKPKIKDEFNHGWVKIRKEGIVPTNVAYNRNLDAYNQCLFYGKDKSELDEVELLTYKAYYENEKYVVPQIPVFKTEKNGDEIFSNLADKEAKAIVGVISIDELKNEIKKAKEMGLDEITKEMQSMWNKMK